MIRHIVLMRFKKDASEADIATVWEKLGQLQKSIPQILSFSGGICNSPENLHQGFVHGFTMDFANETSRDIYLNHSQHKQVVENNLLHLLEDGYNSVVVFDYQLPE